MKISPQRHNGHEGREHQGLAILSNKAEHRLIATLLLTLNPALDRSKPNF
jgi:hypothetical protein